jgi:hypothetical protein
VAKGSVALRPVSVAPCQRPPVALDAKHPELALPQRHVQDSYMAMAMMSVGMGMGCEARPPVQVH